MYQHLAKCAQLPHIYLLAVFDLGELASQLHFPAHSSSWLRHSESATAVVGQKIKITAAAYDVSLFVTAERADSSHAAALIDRMAQKKTHYVKCNPSVDVEQ